MMQRFLRQFSGPTGALGHVAGVDRSDVMLRQAMRRNRSAIRAGRVALQQGDATRLPFADASATRALAVNSLQFWSSPEAGLRELARVLAPGGRLVLAQRARRQDAGRYDRSRFGMTDDDLASLARILERVGFQPPEIERREIDDETIAALITAR